MIFAVPVWLIWVIVGLMFAVAAHLFGKQEGQWDFVSPLIGCGIMLVFFALLGGWLLGRWL